MTSENKPRIAPPSPGVIARLHELAKAATREDWREFCMSIPARPERDADLVLSNVAYWIAQSLAEREELAGIIDDLLQFARECMLQGDVIPIDEPGEETWADFLARARQAVERLRGG
jgi:hypothetical protein